MANQIKKRGKFFLFLVLVLAVSFQFPNMAQFEETNSKIKGDELQASWALNGIQISNVIGDQQDPQICDDGSDGAYIVWDDFDIHIQRIDANGNKLWGENGITLCNNTATQTYAEVCSDGLGGAIVTWRDLRTPASGSDVYAQRINQNGVIQWQPNGTIICNATGAQDQIKIISDGNNGAIIAWRDQRNGNQDIFAQKINSNGNGIWGPNGTAINNYPENQDELEICSDGSQGAIIAFQSFSGGGTKKHIYAQRIDNIGSLRWNSSAIIICNYSDWLSFPDIISDGSGGAYIAWNDNRGAALDIYIQRLRSDGSIYFSSNGTVVTSATNNQAMPELVGDNNGGVIITWHDQRNGNYDIYAQRMSATGTIYWTSNGLAVCVGTGDQQIPKICTDGEQGAIISWIDSRIGTWDIYSQWINGSGTAKWTTNGVPLCTGTSAYYSTIPMLNRGVGRAFVTWYDDRGADDDIYIASISNPPTINHPQDVTTSAWDDVTIDWTIYDTGDGGEYRILANDSNDIMYVWVDWTVWTPNIANEVVINRTLPGIYEYIIEYYNQDYVSGLSDSVVVTIIDILPSSNEPEDIFTTMTDWETITWILIDDYGAGYFRIIANDTNNNYFVWMDWTRWTNNTPIYVPINRITIGTFNYTIFFNTSLGQYYSDSVLVNITISNLQGPPGPEGPPGISDELVFTLLTISAVNLLITLVLYTKLSRKMKKLKPKEVNPDSLDR